ncbi:hypothetical protein SLEP1_g51026 [Rubroshorea leprosula]|uniref:N-acetyltransferase domain-containing protein n=1 Tax=Rubroshorea leprosula TaxID=152421 RepID=A0AAV5M4C0_9ROSI|nr:hypothetical protein SLEP1_g51026 [Rubroshorea leprosula]
MIVELKCTFIFITEFGGFEKNPKFGGFEELEALVDVENIGSQRVLEKAGFTREGVSRKCYICSREEQENPDLGFFRTQIWVFLEPRSGFFWNPDLGFSRTHIWRGRRREKREQKNKKKEEEG